MTTPIVSDCATRMHLFCFCQHNELMELITCLPFFVIGEVLIDVFRRICEKVELVAFVRKTIGAADTSGHVTRTPVAVNESPGFVHPHGRPLVAEGVALETHARSVAGAFRVPVNHLALETGVTGNTTVDGRGLKPLEYICFQTNLNTFYWHTTNQEFRPRFVNAPMI